MAKGKGQQLPPFEAWQAEINRPKTGPRRILSKADAFRKPFFPVYKPHQEEPTIGTKIFLWSVRLILIALVTAVIIYFIKGRAVSEWLPQVLVFVSVPLGLIFAIWDPRRRKPMDDE